MFCFLYNLTDKPRQVVLRVQSPDFRPHDLSLKYSLAPGEKMWWSDSAIPVASKGDDDQLGRMSGLLQDGTVAWQTLLPVRTGEASVAIRLEEPSGDLLVGRQINIQVRSEFRSWLRNTGSVACYFIGGCGLIAATIFQAMALILHIACLIFQNFITDNFGIRNNIITIKTMYAPVINIQHLALNLYHQ